MWLFARRTSLKQPFPPGNRVPIRR